MAAACTLLGLHAAGCAKDGAGIDLARWIRPPGTPTDPAPPPVSPAAALRLLEWCYNHRAIGPYVELLADDYRFFCSATDSAGAEYRDTPWTREDEIISATHLFGGGNADQPPALALRLLLDRSFVILPDPERPDGRWHKGVRTQVVLDGQLVDGSAFRIVGNVTFYLVRGDSALIPEELRARGVGPDSTRWYLRRWDDETAQPGLAVPDLAAHGSVGAPGRPPRLRAQPTKHMTWCQLKVAYR